jgi:hypothetical protein
MLRSVIDFVPLRREKALLQRLTFLIRALADAHVHTDLLHLVRRVVVFYNTVSTTEVLKHIRPVTML